MILARIFRDTTEVDISTLSDRDVHSIILNINSLWEGVEAAPLVFRCIPIEGQLIVHAGLMDECRCSESEVMLADPWDIDIHHFIPCDFPEWIVTNLLLEEYHPIGDDGLMVSFD